MAEVENDIQTLVKTKRCVYCGSEFRPKTLKGMYCSSLCKSRHYASKKTEKTAERQMNEYLDKASSDGYIHTRKGVVYKPVIIDGTVRYEHICAYCGNTFVTDIKRIPQKCCSDECNRNHFMRYQRAYNLQNKNTVTKKLSGELTLGYDYVECPICHERHAQINLNHFKRHGYTCTEDVVNDFPDLKMTCVSQIEQYLAGDNNPMSMTKTDTKKRKESSPYSIEHYLKKNNGNHETAHAEFKAFLDGLKDKRKTWNEPTRIEYYLAKGMSETEAREALKQRQTMNGLDYYIKRYGETEGARRYSERIDRWAKKTLTGLSHSTAEKQCINLITDGNEQGLLFGDNSFVCKSELTHKRYTTDLMNPANNRIIEFFGDYWHCNPAKYDKDFFNKSSGKYASDIWKYDADKIHALEAAGYTVMVIWEDDFRNRTEDIINEAKRFIFGN